MPFVRAARPDVVRVLDHLDSEHRGAVARLLDFLSFPSISTDPAFHSDCVAAAEWCVNNLREVGFEAELRPSEGKPVVIGHWHATGGESFRVLFYGHYDVQPPEPLEEWTTPPFKPQLIGNGDGRIVGRGTSDDKGQVMTFIEACRSWVATHGHLPVSVTVLLEGEEEIGSQSLPAFLDRHAEELAADLCLICDTHQWDEDTPAITTRLRGLAFSELTIAAAARDLHSGLYGGVAQNPVRVLAGILAELHDPSGRVAIPGFYEDVLMPPLIELAQWQQLEFDGEAFLDAVGLSETSGEEGFSMLERLWSRPTADVNGIRAGHTGPGTKTIIPAQATAKISFRLVPDQKPQAVLGGLHRFVQERLPPDCIATFSGEGGVAAVSFDVSQPAFEAAARALEQEWNRPPVLIGCGGTVPIVETFRSQLGMDTLLVGFALHDDRIHAPNEKYNVKSFAKGARSWARILNELGTMHADAGR